jgi:hypothetical protein
LDNPIYHFWRFFVVLVCIASSLIYAYLAAFGVPEYGTTMFYIDYSFEVIFACDMIVQFLLEFKPEDQYNRVRDLTEIAKRYLKGRFFIDLISQIPFYAIFSTDHDELFYIIKIIRIQKGYHLLSSNSFMKNIKHLFNLRL